jgi:hypothetical protein
VIDPTTAMDYDEIVKVADIGPTRSQSRSMETGQRPVEFMSLYRAVRMIVEEWDGDQPRQLGVVISRETGSPLSGLKAIRAVYERKDFPSRS